MAGLIDTGRFYKQSGVNALGLASSMEQDREARNDALKNQKKQGQIAAAGTGAGIGMMAGMQAGGVTGPVGALIGAGVGLLASSLFD